MIEYNLMENKIAQKEAVVIKKNQTKSKRNNVHIKFVEYGENTYKLCPVCMSYQILVNFYQRKDQSYYSDCYNCRRKKSSKDYDSNVDYYIRIRLQSINKRAKSKGGECTLDEFKTFFYNAKDPHTGQTLYDDWKNPNPNPNLRLEIDHIIPLSSGGSSKPNNLQVFTKAVNRIKGDCTPEQFRETLDFISNIVLEK